MKWIKDRQSYIINEASTFKAKSVISEICVAMLLLNPEFLDNILDRGMKARYSENTKVFVSDLRNLVFGNNRLKCGVYNDDICVTENETSKINQYFSQLENNFEIEKDWSTLVRARNIARNIQDKLLDYKLEESNIRNVFWLGPNKEKGMKQDIVVEVNDGTQYNISINSKISLSKTQSFNTLFEDLIGEDNISKLHSEENKGKWDKLCQEWLRIIYENSNNTFKLHIEKFIDPDRIYSVKWDNLFQLKHRDKKYQFLGEHIEELDKNILYLHDLLNEIWKNGNLIINNFDEIKESWLEIKIAILNSRIIEHLVTSSLKNQLDEDEKLIKQDNHYVANDNMKNRILKMVTNTLGFDEMDIYFFNTEDYTKLPAKTFLRDNFDNIDILFDYHVNLTPRDDEDDSEINDSQFNIKINHDSESLMDININTSFGGGELTSKLSSKIKVEVTDLINKI
jgi:hypothetical protein